MNRFWIALAASLIFFGGLRFIPVGTKSPSQDNNPGATRNIEIKRGRYWIPREIAFSGFPLPGGDLQLMTDPHYDYGTPVVFEVLDEAGKSIEGRIQNIGINPYFDNPRHVESILAIAIADDVLEIDLARLDATYSWMSRPFFGGQTGGSALFLIDTYDDRLFLLDVAISASGLKENISEMRTDGSSVGQQFEKLSVMVSSGKGEDPCESSLRPIIGFYELTFGITCETLN